MIIGRQSVKAIMEKYTVDQIRQMFLEFFREKQHQILPSASLVPHDDPTLLLTVAGMVPFKRYFLGYEKPESKRVSTCQRCIRTPDIENVGKTDRHGTFFEMLGNFSFGDYFKEEAITWAWEFVTERLKFPKQSLWVSIYHEDDEAFEIWNKKIQVPTERIIRLGEEDNFWGTGTGPCGPCSEIYIDRGKEYGCADNPDCKPGCECERFMEFWNLVFIQFHQDETGKRTPLESKSIDTGMGLERVAVLTQGVKSIFESDLIYPIVDEVARLAGTKYGEDEKKDVSLRVITDHVRGMTFLVHDGVIPSNEGRGYVLRRLLRRAARHGKLLGIEGSFLNKIVDVVIKQMKTGYPELEGNAEYIKKVIGIEEQRFQETLDQGIVLLERLIERLKERGDKVLPGTDVFRLYDTYGFPVELTKEISAEEDIEVDEDGFQQAMEQQRERARSARTSYGYLGTNVDAYKDIREQVEVEFIGYNSLETSTKVVALLVDDQQVDVVNQGQKVSVVLEKTPFYAEGGGQVGDSGTITSKDGQISIEDVKKPLEGIVVHKGVVSSGQIKVGDTVIASVYQKERLDTARNHTATHLLHKALKQIIGEHANQSGSYVAPERLRFDFTHFEALTKEQLFEIERLVNETIMKNIPLEAIETSIDKAQEMGATALFGEKYGSKVRVVKIGDYSMELCGGTHVGSTGDIGLFRIVSEGSVAAGVRRIEAVTGKYALKYVDEKEKILENVCEELQTKPEDLLSTVQRLLEQRKALETEIKNLKRKDAESLVDGLIQSATKIEEISVVVSDVNDFTPEDLRELGDKIRSKLDPAIVFLGSSTDDKVYLLSMISKSIAQKPYHAGELVKVAAKICGGGGGGRPDMAQAGGRLPEKLGEALEEVKRLILESEKR